MSFIELMHDADPATHVEPATPQCRAAILEASMAARPARRPSRWVRPLVAASIAGALALTGLAASGLMGETPEARADALLAEAAINATDPPAEPGQYWEITTTYEQLLGYDDAEYKLEWWDQEFIDVSGDRPTWYAVRMDETYTLLRGSEREKLAHDEPDYWVWTSTPKEQPSGWWEGKIPDLPRDPGALRQRLYEYANTHSNPDWAAFTGLEDLLHTNMVPADLRSAVFEVMRTIPGVRVVEEGIELGGRTGVAFAVGSGSGADEEYQMVVDTLDGTVIGKRSMPVGAESDEAVVGAEIIERRLVDEVPEWLQKKAEKRDYCWVDFDDDGETIEGCA